MRHVEFPTDQLCVVQGLSEKILVSYQKFLDENVWTDAKWRSSEEFARLRQRLIPLFDAAFAAGARGVSLQDKDHEKWEPIAALRGAQLAPQNVRPLSVFTDAAMFASTTEPEWAKTPAAPQLPEAPAA